LPGSGLSEAHVKASVTKAASETASKNSTRFAGPLRSHASQLVKIVEALLIPVILAAGAHSTVKVYCLCVALRH